MSKSPSDPKAPPSKLGQAKRLKSAGNQGESGGGGVQQQREKAVVRTRAKEETPSTGWAPTSDVTRRHSLAYTSFTK